MPVAMRRLSPATREFEDTLIKRQPGDFAIEETIVGKRGVLRRDEVLPSGVGERGGNGADVGLAIDMTGRLML